MLPTYFKQAALSLALLLPTLLYTPGTEAKTYKGSFLCKEKGYGTVLGITTKSFHAAICEVYADNLVYIGRPVSGGKGIKLPAKATNKGGITRWFQNPQSIAIEDALSYEAYNGEYKYKINVNSEFIGALTVYKSEKIIFRETSDKIAMIE